ncbi:hypothetical protein Echvi_3753 [Echinicola vietnamensis DSM 17526]|uniref:Uncharacterized protein n=1 Tax=Echinicola vietnamensis (strain DSM 17526 / LMG 23754 / KMM 6221) TaxID=926556 RepID=L0G564_ECHVK|nr:hypothetical protein Echvi_3753 [Echinicola vietnamensis DSM 17526]
MIDTLITLKPRDPFWMLENYTSRLGLFAFPPPRVQPSCQWLFLRSYFSGNDSLLLSIT